VDTVLLQPLGISSHHHPQLLVYLLDHLQASVVTTVPKAVTMVLKGTLPLQVSHQMELHLALRRHQVSECLECLLDLLLRQVCLQVCPLMLTKDDELVLYGLEGFIYDSRKKLLFLARRFMGIWLHGERRRKCILRWERGQRDLTLSIRIRK
jgi:hypothetical protein